MVDCSCKSSQFNIKGKDHIHLKFSGLIQIDKLWMISKYEHNQPLIK